MRALEREVGQVMIEARGIELHDVGRAALVFRVAGAAFADAGVGHSPVKPEMIAHVGRDRPCDSPGTAMIACATFERSWQLAQFCSCFSCARVTLPGISRVSTDAAKAVVAAMHAMAVIHPRMTDQYTLTAMTCTIPAINNMKNSGMCSTCHNENKRAYA